MLWTASQNKALLVAAAAVSQPLDRDDLVQLHKALSENNPRSMTAIRRQYYKLKEEEKVKERRAEKRKRDGEDDEDDDGKHLLLFSSPPSCPA